MDNGGCRVLSQLINENGNSIGRPVDLSVHTTKSDLKTIYDTFIENEDDENTDTIVAFYVNSVEITKTIGDILFDSSNSTENIIKITCQPESSFNVRCINRCTSTIPGHDGAILSVSFSPDGNKLATGSGDCTIRLWDLTTETPESVLKAHTGWILALSWLPKGNKLISGCKKGEICIWNIQNKSTLMKKMKPHQKWITQICSQPININSNGSYFVSVSKDGTGTIIDSENCQIVANLSGHSQCITCVKWSGSNLILTGSEDRTIRIWSQKGELNKVIQNHAHWVNHIALSNEYTLKIGCFFLEDKTENSLHNYCTSSNEIIDTEKIVKRYESSIKNGGERFVSCSDDMTMFLWTLLDLNKPIARLTGHQAPINHVVFSPDGRFIASGSFDKSIKLWDGYNGKFICSFRGHIHNVYQVSWSADSRMLVSASADSTLKVWDIKNKKLKMDLPGHADEVYAVDWSSNGLRVASGGKDKNLKLWRS